MKKISVKMFFTVMWRGLCQALRWFFGLFGYKRDGMFAKCVGGVFSCSAAILMGLFALVAVTSFCEMVYEKHYKEAHCYDPDCLFSEFLGDNIYYHSLSDGRGYVFNSQDKKKVLRNIAWIAKSEEDSLVCFSNGKKRGYFNRNTGKVVIPAKYNHAWVFSEGLASVDENGSIKFIDGIGNTVIDNVMPYVPGMDGMIFHGGYCVVDKESPELCVLIDKSGKSVLPEEYRSITLSDDHELWIVSKGDEQAVYNKNLKLIIPLTKTYIETDDNYISMSMPDHTIRKYAHKGDLVNDFYITCVRTLEYEKEEIVSTPPTQNIVSDEIVEIVDDTFHPKATARLRAYIAGHCYEGLMTADGHRVTMPIYQDIDAIGSDTYLCTVSNGDKVVVNGKGEVIK